MIVSVCWESKSKLCFVTMSPPLILLWWRRHALCQFCSNHERDDQRPWFKLIHWSGVDLVLKVLSLKQLFVNVHLRLERSSPREFPTGKISGKFSSKTGKTKVGNTFFSEEENSDKMFWLPWKES